MAQGIINRNLYWLRTSKEWRQEDVATKLGISRPAYLNYEDDRAVPEELLPMLSKLYKTPVQDLLHKEMMPPDILEAYKAKRAQKKNKGKIEKEGSSTKDEVIEVDRSFINEVLLRTNIRQNAKILAILQNRPLKEVQAEINEDNLEVMNELIKWFEKKGKSAFGPVFSSEA